MSFNYYIDTIHSIRLSSNLKIVIYELVAMYSVYQPLVIFVECLQLLSLSIDAPIMLVRLFV